MQARCHKDDNMDGKRLYTNLQDGYPIQENLAKELYQKARLEEGPCGITESEAFQNVLPSYKLKVMAVDSPHMIIYQGPPAPHKILLLKVDDHYHGCSSFAGFLSKSFYCHNCDRGFDVDDYDIARAKDENVLPVTVSVVWTIQC